MDVNARVGIAIDTKHQHHVHRKKTEVGERDPNGDLLASADTTVLGLLAKSKGCRVSCKPHICVIAKYPGQDGSHPPANEVIPLRMRDDGSQQKVMSPCIGTRELKKWSLHAGGPVLTRQ